MSTYIVRRLLWTVVVLLGVSITTFGALFISPIDPAVAYAGDRAHPKVIAQVRHELGLDRPLYIQYAKYMWRLMHGDLGRSYFDREEVLQRIKHRLPATAQLALSGVIAQLLIGIPIGIISAIKQQSLADRAALLYSLFGIVTPPFVLGLLLLYYLAYRLDIFPLSGYGSLQHLILPTLTLGLAGGAWYARMLRSSILDIIEQDYVRTARAKGLRERVVVLRHILRNALAPIVMMVGMDIGTLLGGIVVVERVFNWPGIGRQVWLAIGHNDIPLIMGTVLFSAVFIAVMNLVADIANAMLDPRIRYE